MTDNELDIREWFSRLLKNDPKNAGKTVTQRRADAKRELPKILLKLPHGREWKIFKVQWKSPTPPSTRHRITVLIKEKKNHPPDDAKVPPKPQTPPPYM